MHDEAHRHVLATTTSTVLGLQVFAVGSRALGIRGSHSLPNWDTSVNNEPLEPSRDNTSCDV